MSLFLFILAMAVLAFRWPILKPLIGTIRMFLFDAILFTVIAAINFAQPGPWAGLGYAVAGLCVYFAISAGIKYLKYSELQRIENEKGNSDPGPTAGV